MTETLIMFDSRRGLRSSTDKGLFPDFNTKSASFLSSKGRYFPPLLVASAIVVFFFYVFTADTHTTLVHDESVYHGKPKNALVITSDEKFPLPNGDKQVHYTQGGIGSPLFLLIHGESRIKQDSRHWMAHYDLFDTLGTFCSVDLLGYGTSFPGKSEDVKLSVPRHAEYLDQLLSAKFSQLSDMVFVARGWGVSVALELAKKSQTPPKAFVFIAPEFDEVTINGATPSVLSTPMLLVWAKDDPVAEFSEHHRWLELFSNVDTLFFEKVAELGMHELVANTPESIRVFEFQNGVHDFLVSKKLVHV